VIALIISAAQLLIGTLHIGSPETKLVFTDVDHHPFYGSNLLTDPNCHTHCKGWTLRFRVVNESRHPVYVEDVDVAYAVNGNPLLAGSASIRPVARFPSFVPACSHGVCAWTNTAATALSPA
jgi:hypothetical protein